MQRSGMGAPYRSQRGKSAGPTMSLSLLSGLPSWLTFSRASNATMFNAAGQRVWAPANMLTNTDMTTGGWILNTATRSVAGTSPPFTGNPVIKLVTNSGVSTTGPDSLGGLSVPNSAVSVGQTMVFVVYAKAAEVDSLRFRETVSTGNRVKVSLVDGSVVWEVGAPGANLSVTVTAASGGWWAISCQRTCSSAVFGGSMKPGLDTGDGTSGVYLACPQLCPYDANVVPAFVTTSGTAYYGPRFDFNPVTLAARGFLMEGQITNQIKNSEMVGASVGVHPTGWTAGNSNAVATSVVGVGTEDGMPYVDVMFAGTASAAGTTNLEFDISTDVAAATGQQWCGSVFLRKISGTDPSGSKVLQVIEGNPGFLAAGAINIAPSWGAASLALNRPYISYLTVNAATTNVRLVISMAYALLEVVAVTLRIACPQLEGGTGSSAFAPTSPIPTYGVAAARAADSATAAAPFINAIEGTVFADFETNMANASAFVPAVCFSDGTAANRTHMSSVLTTTTIAGIMHGVTAGVNDVNAGLTPAVAGGRVKGAYRYRLNDWAGCSNGGAITADVTGLVPIGMNTMHLGQSSPVAALAMTRWLRQINYYNRGFTNAELQALTA